MSKSFFYTCLVFLLGVVCSNGAYAQLTPNADYNAALPGGINAAPKSGSGLAVCPSLDNGLENFPSISTFNVEVNAVDAGTTRFEWVVYGGTITEANGSGAMNEAFLPQSAGGFSYYYISSDNYTAGPTSSINVQWDRFDLVAPGFAWVAVRQISEWGCLEGPWSVFTNEIFNPAPTFQVNVPQNISIPNDSKVGFTLPNPQLFTDDEGCPRALTYELRIDRVDPLPDILLTYTDQEITDLSGVIQLVDDLGDGLNTVTWTISDGMKQASYSYTITVEPALQILNVAWNNPHSGLSNGAVWVTNVTSLPVNADRSIDYKFDLGAFQAADTKTDFAGGVHTVQARLTYLVDTDNDPGTAKVPLIQLSEVYTFELTSMAANAVDNVPNEAEGAVIVAASCKNTPDGAVSIDPTAMNSQNSSVFFNGTNSYLLLKKQYNSAINAFTVAAWVKTSATSGSIVSFDNSEYYHLGLNNGRLQLTTPTRTVTVQNTDRKVNNDQWHLVVATYSAGSLTLYIDGIQAEPSVAAPLSIGTGVTRFGMIGSLSKTATFTDNPGGNYFIGYIAEVGIWDNALAPANIVQLFTTGMTSVGSMADHWVLNDVPDNVSNGYPDVFTDLYNDGVNTANYARFYNLNGARSTNEAPTLYSWTDDATWTKDMLRLDIFRDGLEANSLSGKTYTFEVRDIYGYGTNAANYAEPYDVPNGDQDPPILLWNMAVGKLAHQINNDASASLASDGLGDTYSDPSAAASPWWDISLGGNYPIRMVRVNAHADLGNIYVILSPTPFDAGSTLTDDRAKGPNELIAAIAADGMEQVVFPDGTYARYVRVRASGSVALQLNEVEILTDYDSPVDTRRLLITDECTYTITTNDVTIDPVVYDKCGGVTSLITTNQTPNIPTLVDLPDDDLAWPVDDADYQVDWEGTDDNGNTTPFTMYYNVDDKEKPKFVVDPVAFPLVEVDPFDGMPTNFTKCEADVYEFPIPNVLDNYENCEEIDHITLLRDGGVEVYNIDLATYDPKTTPPGVVPANVTRDIHLISGDHVFTWEAVDARNNITTYNSPTIHVETVPLLKEVRIAADCEDPNEYIVYFSKIESEVGDQVTYILRPDGGGPDINPANLTDNFITNIPTGTYSALFSVNGCESNISNDGDVVIPVVNAIDPNEEVINVDCLGNLTGSIDITPNGGSQTDILHLTGNAQIKADNYPALNLTTSGMIEAYVFLDTLLVGGLNSEAGLFGVINSGSGNGYGLKMVGGALTFYAGDASVSVPYNPSGAFKQRVWTHIAGEFSWNSGLGTGSLNLYIDGVVAANTALVADPSIPTGDVYIGSTNGANYLQGFVRNARIWNTMPSTFTINRRLYRAIDPTGNSMVANFPVNETGGSFVYNVVNTGTTGTITGTTRNQQYAYYWLDLDGDNADADGVWAYFDEDLDKIPTGTYRLTLYDPLGCDSNFDIEVDMDDDDPPTMTFYRTGAIFEGNELDVDEPIIRYTDDVSSYLSIVNVTDDCYYFPYDGEFDPVPDDGGCPSGAVVLTYTRVPGSDLWGFPEPTSPANDHTLDGIGMTGIITLEWTATDPNGLQSAPQQVSYYILDNEDPVMLNIAAVIEKATDEGYCTYTVPLGDVSLLPTLTDNCLDMSLGTLENDVNGSDNLDGVVFEPGDHLIEWTYRDRDFPDNPATTAPASRSFILRVLDQQLPTANCVGAYTARLDADGLATIDYSDLDLTSEDNCGSMIDEFAVTRNVAYNLATASQSSGGNANNALDNDAATNSLTNSEDYPYWQIDLGAEHAVLALQLYNGATALNNFWVLVSTDGTFDNTSGLWTEAGATFGPDVVHAQYYAGAIVGSELVGLTKAATGQYVRIVLNATGAQLSLAEVEVYGTTNLATASSLQVDCQDIRYTEDADPTVKGTFAPIGILLTVFDDNPVVKNIGSCLVNVTVIDEIPPVVEVDNASIELSPNSGEFIYLNTPANLALIDNGTTDNCSSFDDLYMVAPTDAIGCLDVGNYPITFRVYDGYANYRDRNVVPVIDDVTPPVMIPRASVVLPLNSDGEYTVQVTDLLSDWGDNCTPDNQISFDIQPPVVYCADKGYIDITITATDANTRTSSYPFLAANSVVLVEDPLPPTFSLEAYTHIIPSTGSAAITFDDIVRDGNLHDNCTDVEDLDRYIRYEILNQPTEWCGYGYEGGGSTAIENLAHLATGVTGTTALSGFPRTNANDDKPSGAVETSNQTYFAPGDIGGNYTLQYNFGKTYEFESVEALWADVTSTDGNIALSHVTVPATYLPVGNITTDNGNTTNRNFVKDGDNATSMSLRAGTGGADAFYIEYEFTQPVMVANMRLRWAVGSTFDAESSFQYQNPSGVWTAYPGTIANSTSGLIVKTINATVRAQKVRLYYDPAAGITPAIAEWYVYGQLCTTYTVDEPLPSANTAGYILVSHSTSYRKGVTALRGSNVGNVCDNNNETTEYTLATGGGNGALGEWVEYEFYAPITISRAEIHWGTRPSPNPAMIQYYDGNNWVDIGNIGNTGSAYNILNISEVSASRVRVAFTERTNQLRISNFRIYGVPCSTPPSVTALTAPTISSSSVRSASYPHTRLNDNTTNSNPWEPNAGLTAGWHWGEYSYSQPIVMSSFTVYWSNIGRMTQRFVQYYNDYTAAWVNIRDCSSDGATSTLSSLNICATRFRIYFYGNRDAVPNYPGVFEFDVNGYSVASTYSGCWSLQPVTYYNDAPAVTSQIPFVTPTSATIQYSNDGGASWSATQPVTTTAFPASVNLRYLNGGAGSVVQANALKLNFDNTTNDGYNGLYELRANGRRIPQVGDETDQDACYTFTCAHVHTDQTVYLRAVDESDREGIASIVVPIEPYFNIYDMQIKDCGYSGERYYPNISNLSPSLTYTYIWDAIDDRDDGNNRNYLFQEYDCEKVDYLTQLPYTMPIPGQNWIGLITSACYPYPNDGDYIVELEVQDDNVGRCWDTYTYEFRYEESNTTATSIKRWEVCKNDIQEFEVAFPDTFEFYYEGTLDLDWTYTITGGNFAVLSGGAHNDLSIEVQFLKTTAELGSPTEIQVGYRARKLSPDVTVSSTKVLTKVGGETNVRVIPVVGKLFPEKTHGPYWIEYPAVYVWLNTLANGEQYIVANGNYDYGDYANCYETAVYSTTVRDVTLPIIEAARLNNGVLSGYTTITGAGAQPFPICVRDTITYRVQDYDDTEFVSLTWSFMSDHAEPVPTGRRLAGGSGLDQTIQMVWDIYSDDPEYMPRLTVEGFNSLGCTAGITEVNHLFTDVTPPVLDCSGMNRQEENGANRCGLMFTNLPEPDLITDDCYNRIEEFWCEVDMNGDGDLLDAGDISHGTNAAGFYPVGLTTITWKARDYSTNVGSCTQTIRVLDTEAPSMSTPPADIDDLEADDDCEHTFTLLTHDVTANDICSANNTYVADNTIAKVYRYNSVSGLYDILADNQPPAPGTSLVGTVFEKGRWRVEWTTSDGVDNSLYGAYPNDGNKASLDFYVTVIDETPPTIDDFDGVAVGIQLAPITLNGLGQPIGNDPGSCEADLSALITRPGYDDRGNIFTFTDPGGILDDNCSDPSALTVELVGRSDGKPVANLPVTGIYPLAPFNVGNTTLTWRVTDEAGNWTRATQVVTVVDDEAPTMDPLDAALQDRTITYCQRINLKLPIPLPDDNCGLANIHELTYSVVSINAVVPFSFTGTIQKKNNAFTNNGTGLTDVITDFDQHVNTYAQNVGGTSFTVTWSAEDEKTNTSIDYTYTLDVEIEPLFTTVTAYPLTCGGANNGAIVISSDDPNSDDYHYDRDHTPQFSINNGITYTDLATINALPLAAGNYTVKMKVNGCVSAYSVTKTITSPPEYVLETEITAPILCYEDTDGEISLTMTGGDPDLLHFATASSYSAPEYPEIELTNTGSVEAWVYLDDVTPATLVGKGASYGLKFNGSKFVLYLGATELVANTVSTIIPQRWYYVAGTWNAGQTQIYIDAIDAPVSTGGGAAASVNDAAFTMGNFNGMLRDVRIWNTVQVDEIDVVNGVPRKRRVGDEPGLVGYWKLNDGSNPTSSSTLLVSGFGTDASGTGTWESTMPQPGVYSWTRDLAPHSYATQLENLGRGTYDVLFVDPYNCPDPLGSKKLTSKEKMVPTDRTPPVIEAIGDLTVNTENGFCNYVLSDATRVTNNTPTITDDEGCDYSVTWKVVTDYNEALFGPVTYSITDGASADPKILGASLGRGLAMGNDGELHAINGKNTVTVSTLQGTDVRSERSYRIFVEDDDEPTADGEFPDNLELDEFGQFILDADDFNNGSSDNCNLEGDRLYYELSRDDGTTWAPSIVLDCDDIGESLTIQFRATDETYFENPQKPILNQDVLISSVANLEVKDVTAPTIDETNNQPKGPYCATIDADILNNKPAATDVRLSDLVIGFHDNCDDNNVIIEYKLTHPTYAGADYGNWVEVLGQLFDPAIDVRFYEGVTTVVYRLSDDAGNVSAEKPVFRVTVLPKPIPGAAEAGHGAGIE